MTDVDDEVNKIDELVKKLNKCNNNVKLILQLLKTMDEKINEKKGFKENGEAFEKKGIGRPTGDLKLKESSI